MKSLSIFRLKFNGGRLERGLLKQAKRAGVVRRRENIMSLVEERNEGEVTIYNA